MLTTNSYHLGTTKTISALLDLTIFLPRWRQVPATRILLTRGFFSGIIACVALLTFAGLVRAEAAAADLTEAEALKTAQSWATLVEAADVAGLETLLHESYTHTHGTGLLESKSRFLEMLQNGERDYVRAAIKDPVVNLFGPTALVKGTLDFKVVVPEKQIEGQNRFMMVLVRTKDGVEVAAYQATLLNRVDTPAPTPQAK